MGIRPDDRDGSNLSGVERQEAAFVFEQDDGFARGLKGESAVRIAAHYARGFVRIHVGIVEQAQAELPFEHRRHQFVELRFAEHAFADQFGEVEVAIGLGQLDVDAGADGERAGLLLVSGDVVPVRVGTIAQLPDGVIVGDDEAAKPPLLAQDVAQQPAAGMRGNTVDLVVRSHDTNGAAPVERFPERKQKRLAQQPLGDIRRSAVDSRLRLSMGGKMFQRGDDARFVAKRGVALEAAHGGDAHARYEVRILAVSFFDAAPARIAGHVHHGGEGLVRAAQPGFERGHRKQIFDQRGVEACAERDGLRETGGAGRGLAVQALLVKHDGDPQPGVLQEEALNGVGEFRGFASPQSAAGIRGAADLAQPATVAKSLRGLFRVEAARFVHESLALFLPDAEHLRGLFFERHPLQQVPGAAARCELRIPILFGLRHSRAFSFGNKL